MKPLKGIVVSTKMQNTAVVSVETKWQHPLYKKTIKRTKKYSAHDTLGAKLGDHVTIKSSAPVSKTKRFTLISIDNKTKK